MREGLSRLTLALVLLAFCLPLFIGLGAFDLDNDEAIYSYAVESILTTGDWLGPRASPSADVVFLEKPHLKLWITALPIRLGLLPYGEFGLRFADAVFGALAFVYVLLIGRQLSGSLCGAVAVLVLFAHEKLIFDHGLRSNTMDAAVVLAYCGGVYHYLRWASTDEARRGVHIFAFAGWFYLAFMSKFVAAAFLPAIAGVCALVMASHRRRLLEDRRRWALAAAVVVAAAAPWFLYQYGRHGSGFWHVLFGEHVVTRFTGFTDPSHLRPWHFYFTEGYRQFARSGSAIWIGLGLAIMLVDAARGRVSAAWVILAWAALPLAAISIGSSKLYHYAYPFLPPFAVAAGYGVARLVEMLRGVEPPATAGIASGAAATPCLRTTAALGLLGAIGLVVATAVQGTLQIHAGDRLLFRNTSIIRPAVVAAVCAIPLFGLRSGVIAMLALVLSTWVPMPLKAYVDNLRLLGHERRPLGLLAECVARVDAARAGRGEPSGIYSPVSDQGYLHQYFYYLRGPGWLTPTPDDNVLRAAVFTVGGERPVVMEKAAYSDFLSRVGRPERLPAAIDRPNIVVLLPGPYRECRDTQTPIRR